jgi:GntR family transcriptional regulator, transcriptional repressor for pyruvate dehydrogenase complex
MFEQVQPQKYYMQIARQIKNSIRDGELKIGEKLPSERNLAKEFGASRASIREALSALEMLGLIVCKSGQGNYINADASEGTINTELLKSLLIGHDPNEIFETRLEIEPRLAGLAAERATKSELLEIREMHTKLAEIAKRVNQGDAEAMEEFLEEDRKLHLTIGRCAHNSVLFTVFSALNFMMKETHWKELNRNALKKTGNIKKYMKLNREIIEALEIRDSDKVRKDLFYYIKTIQNDIFLK